MMTFVLFAGDMLVMAFMIGLIVWVSVYANDDDIDAVARLPLEDYPNKGERGDHG